MRFDTNDTIVALSTAHGNAAIAVIRMSGPDAFTVAEKFLFTPAQKPVSLRGKKTHSIHFALFMHNAQVLDEVLVSVFKGPKTYTGNDMIEVSCHGSLYIQQQILSLLLSGGARTAEPGEFTLRAFMNGKLDLSQAEAVNDLVNSRSAISHQVAMSQMRGGFSNKIKILREQLINFASLIELELDFSEEDVEFANRNELRSLIARIIAVVNKLLSSFELGNVIKTGIPVAIVGKPNAGKSTLLNALLEEDKAIVSEIPGTTRDIIEDEISIEGILFRFIDTAGLRTTTDVIEQMGVNRAIEAMKKSAIVIYLFDAHEMGSGDVDREINLLKDHIGNSQLVIAGNKADKENEEELRKEFRGLKDVVFISAKEHTNIHELKERLVNLFDARTVDATDTIVTNARHANSLKNAGQALQKVSDGIEKNLPGDLLALDIRYALNELGSITGEVSSEDLLESIFTRFCIGK